MPNSEGTFELPFNRERTVAAYRNPQKSSNLFLTSDHRYRGHEPLPLMDFLCQKKPQLKKDFTVVFLLLHFGSLCPKPE